MKEISPTQLKKVLRNHKKWLNGTGGERGNLSGYNLTHRVVSNVNLNGMDFIGSDLSNTQFFRVSAKYTNFSGSNLTKAHFTIVDLSHGTFLNTNLRYSRFTNCKLFQSNFSQVDGQFIIIEDSNLEKSLIHQTDWQYAKLYTNSFKHADLNGVLLDYSVVASCDFTNSHLSTVIFHCGDFLGTRFYHSALENCEFNDSSIERTNIMDSRLTNVSFDRCPLRYDVFGMTTKCPEEGSFIGYTRQDNRILVVKIPESADRVSGSTNICRTNQVEILRIEDLNGRVSTHPIFAVGDIIMQSLDKTLDGSGIKFVLDKRIAQQAELMKKS